MVNISDYSSLDKLSALSSVIQILNLIMNVEQTSNQDVMEELQNQDINYLLKILDNQKTILDKLKKIENIVKTNT